MAKKRGFEDLYLMRTDDSGIVKEIKKLRDVVDEVKNLLQK